jgi:hypothetical protein
LKLGLDNSGEARRLSFRPDDRYECLDVFCRDVWGQAAAGGEDDVGFVGEGVEGGFDAVLNIFGGASGKYIAWGDVA